MHRTKTERSAKSRSKKGSEKVVKVDVRLRDEDLLLVFKLYCEKSWHPLYQLLFSVRFPISGNKSGKIF